MMASIAKFLASTANAVGRGLLRALTPELPTDSYSARVSILINGIFGFIAFPFALIATEGSPVVFLLWFAAVSAIVVVETALLKKKRWTLAFVLPWATFPSLLILVYLRDALFRQ
jgi:hypothetical protein